MHIILKNAHKAYKCPCFAGLYAPSSFIYFRIVCYTKPFEWNKPEQCPIPAWDVIETHMIRKFFSKTCSLSGLTDNRIYAGGWSFKQQHWTVMDSVPENCENSIDFHSGWADYRLGAALVLHCKDDSVLHADGHTTEDKLTRLYLD